MSAAIGLLLSPLSSPFQITKTHDDATDADLWREGFGFSGLFSRQVRYIAVSRNIPAEHSHLALEVVIDLAVISDKEAVPSNFVCIDFTADSSMRSVVGTVWEGGF